MEIQGFKVIRTIGRGGMGTVYLATQQSLARAVVLKTMTAGEEGTAREEFIERFLNEARIVASLRHPHIVTIFDIGNDDGVLYISMEYLEGGDLRDKIRDGMPPEEALEVLEKVGEALALAHSEGIIHRDVKPANILYREDGTPLLSDFGIAKRLKFDAELTSTGTILGSPVYMSPEQAEGMQVDGRTDIYSLGVIFYEMLMGSRPYEGDSAVKIIMQHLQAPLPKFPKRFASYQDLLDRMMAKDRQQRFADAAELVSYVQQLRAELGMGSDSEHGSASASHKTGVAGLQRKHVLWGALAGIFLMASGALSLYVYLEITRVPSFSYVSRSSVPVHRPVAVARPAASPNTAGGMNGSGADVRPEEAIKALEWLAKTSFEKDNLTTPPADNAHYYYSRLLALDPGNILAKQGFSTIAERYVILAEKAFSARNYIKARSYITLGLQVEPSNKGLVALRSFIENREKTLLERFIGFFLAG